MPRYTKEEIKKLKPDLYAFLLKVREVFGPVTVRIKK